MSDLPDDEKLAEEFDLASDHGSSPIPPIVMGCCVAAFMVVVAGPPLARHVYNAVFHPETVAPQTYIPETKPDGIVLSQP